MPIEITNRHVSYVIADDGTNERFADARSGTDYCDANSRTAAASVKIAGKLHPAISARREGELVVLGFAETGAGVGLRLTARSSYLVMEVASVQDADVEELVLADLRLTIKGGPDEPFAACALALNLQTNVLEIPQSGSVLRATCDARFGLVGAKAALIGCPQDQLRAVLQQAVSDAPDLPHSPLGGPWAMDAPINRGSYLFNFGDLTVQTADDWIKVARSLGFTQIDFHGGFAIGGAVERSFRFGDCLPNPKLYPRGFDDLKAVIDRLHDAGIAAGLHTYAFFMDKACPWVTPVPDRRLRSDKTLTLAAPLNADDQTIRVVESTVGMSAVTGFFVRNSNTLRFDDELITYSAVSQEPPYQFTGCKRGAWGTRPAAHGRGTQGVHLLECFGLFSPDGDSTLLAEVAQSSADAFNRCGFDMIYLDALDGEDVLGGADAGWHYGSKFVFELWKRLKKPALMEMSIFHHHLWCVRSRNGAWDHSTRAHKQYIDSHVATNQLNTPMFLPSHLGWWAVWPGQAAVWSQAPDCEPTFSDVTEYFCSKAIGTSTGISLQLGCTPQAMARNAGLQRHAAIVKRYEDLRHADVVPQSVRAQLREPGQEFTLEGDVENGWRFRRVQWQRHTVTGLDSPTGRWSVSNKFADQPLRLRIEALMSAGPYDAPDNPVIADCADIESFKTHHAAPGVDMSLQRSITQMHGGAPTGCLTARNQSAPPKAAWAVMFKEFRPYLDIRDQQVMGLWVHGDGQGQVLNCQLRTPPHCAPAVGEHYITIDFTGWRYFELIEHDAYRFHELHWPPYMRSDTSWETLPTEYIFSGKHHIYRDRVEYSEIDALGLWFNNLPQGREVRCYLSAVKALPLVKTRWHSPAISVHGQTIVFPVEMESGQFLEMLGPDDCWLYGSDGNPMTKVAPRGQAPQLANGENQLAFRCESSQDRSARARVTVLSSGEIAQGA